ncbi:MAG: PilW family protein [Pseudohongiellaceae bacterium]
MKQQMNRLQIANNQGLSLIELLVSMVLGLTLATGVVQIYAGSNTTERDREARQRIQENGRFASNFLSQEIRMGGYLGCLGAMQGNTVNNTLNAPPASFQPQFGIQGWEATGTNPGVVNNSAADVALVSTATAEWTTGAAGHVIPVVQAVPNSDIIRIWGAAGSPGIVTSITQGAVPTIQAGSDAGIAANDFLLISDCEQADFVQACVVTPDASPATTSTIALSATCSPGNVANSPISSQTSATNLAEVVRLQGTMFYVGKRNDAAANPPALFRRQLDATGNAGAAEELIEGVESMQILYGINLDQDVRSTVDTYVPANLVTDFADVISVRISLLMQSVEDGTVPAPQGYTFDGVVYDGSGGGNGALPADTKVRRVFVNTISLRNRALGT